MAADGDSAGSIDIFFAAPFATGVIATVTIAFADPSGVATGWRATGCALARLCLSARTWRAYSPKVTVVSSSLDCGVGNCNRSLAAAFTSTGPERCCTSNFFGGAAPTTTGATDGLVAIGGGSMAVG